MDYSRDELRRQLIAVQRQHTASLPAWREALKRIFGDPGTSADAKAALVLGLDRRRLLSVGGTSLLAAAVLAACGDDQEGAIPLAGEALETPTTAEREVSDVVILRTASSLELLAVEAYDAAIDSGLVENRDVAAAARLFRDHHAEHAAFFQAATRDAGGQPFTEANPVVRERVVDPALEALSDGGTEQDVLRFAYSLEQTAASTYQSSMSALTTPQLRQAAMSVGGVEARHAAILAPFIEDSVVVGGLASDTDDATGQDDGAAGEEGGDDPTTEETGATGGDEADTSGPAGAEEGSTGPIAQVPAPFQSLVPAIGPSAYMD